MIIEENIKNNILCLAIREVLSNQDCTIEYAINDADLMTIYTELLKPPKNGQTKDVECVSIRASNSAK